MPLTDSDIQILTTHLKEHLELVQLHNLSMVSIVRVLKSGELPPNVTAVDIGPPKAIVIPL